MREAMKQALEALEYIYEGANNQGPHTGISWRDVSNKAEPIITALRQALANEALDRMAENARELGLDYNPAGGTQVSKVWWDGDKLMAKPIPLSEVYKEPEHQPADEPVACGYDETTGNCTQVNCCYTRPQRERVVFPTMLRKMWSGGEVQAWLDEHVNKEKNT